MAVRRASLAPMSERQGGDILKRRALAWMVGLLLFGTASMVAAQEAKPATRLSRDLAELATPRSAAALSAEPEATPGGFTGGREPAVGDWVTIDAVATGDPSTLEAELIALGATNTAIAGRLVSARLPVSAIPSLEGVVPLRFARRALATTSAGLVTTQGDKAMRADIARNLFDLDGSGVMVGALSDSFNCLGGAATDVSNGDLLPVTVLEELPGCVDPTDEGRAMLQIVHDVAPNAGLAFATAFTGQAGFANNIRALRDAGAKVIVDDVFYREAPMFQDGVIAQAVDEVVASGVTYFSSAGNNARRGYDHAFVPGPVIGGAGTVHLFGATTLMQRISGPPGSQFRLVLQWDSPFFSVSGAPGTQTDLDVYLLDSSGQNVVVAAVTDNLASGDPVEILGPIDCSGSSTCVGNILIANFSGPNPGRLKYVIYANGGNPSLSPSINGGTIYGHPNANGAIAVGAANYKTPTTLETFSSGGTTPVLFDTDGNLLPSPDPRQIKPEIVAPDGVDTSFFGSSGDTDGSGFPNFFGTSAAAPHAAGVAALMLQALPSLTPAEVREGLQSTAKDMGPAGFDNNTGFGLIQADAALNALHEFGIAAGPTGTPNPVLPGGAVSVSVEATDSFEHSLTYGWTATCTGGLLAGVFADAASPVTTWTAAVNATGLTQTCALKVTVSDSHGFTRTATFTATVVSKPRITSMTPSTAAVGGTIVIKGTSLADATEVTFSGPVAVSPTTVTSTSVTVAVPDEARTGVLSVTTPAGVGSSSTIFKVPPKITGFTPLPPANVVGGSADVIAVTGTNLLAASGIPILKIGAMVVPQALITSHTLIAIQFTAPLGALTGKIGLTTADGTTLSATNLTVEQPPRATRFTPPAGPVGTFVTITGTNLGTLTAVTFNGAASVVPTQLTSTSWQAQVPLGAVTGPVSLTNDALRTGASTIPFKVTPKITSFTPGSVVGGSADVIAVTGTNLLAASGLPILKIGAMVVPQALITSHMLTAIQFTAPLGALTGKIGLTTADGTTLSATNLTVEQPPRATKFAPAAGPVGTLVTITGTNLDVLTAVTFNGAAPVVPTLTSTVWQVQVPLGAVTGPVSLTNSLGTGASTIPFKVTPKITDVSPTTAVGGSSTVVAVTGTNLRAATGQPIVKVGTTTVPPSAIVESTPTLLRFTVPLGATSGRVSVTTLDGTSLSVATLSVDQPPRATTFTPAAGSAGTLLTITGTNLTGATEVTFAGGVTATPTAVTPTSLQVTVPAGVLTGPVSITNAIGTGASTGIFKVRPQITSFTPDTAVGGSGTVIEVTGTALRASTGTPTVKVGTTTVPPSAIVQSTPTLLGFTAPLGAATGKISVTTAGGTATSETNLTVVQPPRATSFTPTAGPAGTLVKITGTNLAGATAVTFSGADPVTPSNVTPTSLQVVVPPDAVTGPVSVTNPDGTTTSVPTFKLLPKITGLPSEAPLGSVVVVSGTNLKTGGAHPVVKVGTVVAAVVDSSPTEVSFTVPPLAVTGKITITTVDGTATSPTALIVMPGSVGI